MKAQVFLTWTYVSNPTTRAYEHEMEVPLTQWNKNDLYEHVCKCIRKSPCVYPAYRWEWWFKTSFIAIVCGPMVNARQVCVHGIDVIWDDIEETGYDIATRNRSYNPDNDVELWDLLWDKWLEEVGFKFDSHNQGFADVFHAFTVGVSRWINETSND